MLGTMRSYQDPRSLHLDSGRFKMAGQPSLQMYATVAHDTAVGESLSLGP